jgi:hypothetical protein
VWSSLEEEVCYRKLAVSILNKNTICHGNAYESTPWTVHLYVNISCSWSVQSLPVNQWRPWSYNSVGSKPSPVGYSLEWCIDAFISMINCSTKCSFYGRIIDPHTPFARCKDYFTKDKTLYSYIYMNIDILHMYMYIFPYFSTYHLSVYLSSSYMSALHIHGFCVYGFNELHTDQKNLELGNSVPSLQL